MMKFFTTLFAIFIMSSSFSQDIQGTIVKTDNLEITAYAKPTSSSVTPTASNATAYNIGIRLEKGSLSTAPSISVNSLIGGSVGSINIEEDAMFYTYEGVVNGADFPVTNVNIEVALYTATFSLNANGKFIRLINDDNSNNAFFDIVIPGYSSAMHPTIKFYNGGNSDNSNPSNSWVETAAPLPIILKTFSARKWGDRSARLNWMTSSEVNSAYFGVERSKDALVWENIGHVQAAGESQTERSYEFIDDHLPVGRNASQVYYYRLLMVDLDGKYNYSDIRGLNFRNFFEGIIKVYPNPTTSHINLDLSGWDNTEDNTHLHVYDGTGKQMLKKDIIGNGIELIEVSQWPSGPYNILISKGDKSHHHRIVKVD